MEFEKIGNVETVLKMIRALLAKTEANGATPQEAAAAAEKAQILLQKYNLEVSQLEQAGAEAPAVEKVGLEYNACWMPSLLNVIAKHNFCHVVTARGRKENVHLIGRRSNIEVVQYLYQSLVQQLKTMCDSDVRKYGIFGLSETRNWKKNWFYGAIATINERLREQKEQFDNNPNSKALVTTSALEIKNFLAQEYGNRLKSTTVRLSRDQMAYGLGAEAGKRATMNPGIGSSGQVRQLGG